MRYVVIIMISVLLFASGCGKKEPKASAPAEAKKQSSAVEAANANNVKQKVLSFNLEGLTEKGEKKWDVTGESAEAVTESRVKLNNIVAKSYGEGSEATIVGDDGIYDKVKNNIMLEHNVKATIDDSQSFSKDFMALPSQGPGAEGSLEGGAGKKKTRTVITCDGEVVFDYENNHAYFIKNVKVTSDDANIDADKITVNLDMTTKKVKEIIAEGNVKITRGENVTYSEKATYIEATKSIVLSGRPKIIMTQDGDMAANVLGTAGK